MTGAWFHPDAFHGSGIIKCFRIKGNAHLLFGLDAAQVVLGDLVPQRLDPFFRRFRSG